MPDTTYLGLDLGTSSLKALLLDRQGRLLAQAGAAYPIRRPAPGAAEADPEVWWSAAAAAVAEVRAAAPGPPRAVGLSGQMHGVVLVDAGGEPIRPAILWPDTRATAVLPDYARLPPDAQRRLANPRSPGMAGPILRWLQDREPDALAAARWALQPKDWLRCRLTGHLGSDPSDASGTLLYDLPGDRWDHEVCGHLGVDTGLLAAVAPSASVAGELLPPAAAALGLPAGTPVAVGAADTAAAAFGSGLTAVGDLQLTLGSGGQLVTPLDAPQSHPDRGTHLYRAATARGWYAMGATLNVGLTLDWVRGVTGASWDELYSATDTRPGDPYFLPHLAGERTPYLDPGLRGAWAGLALEHDRSALLRAAVEGVALAVREVFDALPTAGAAPSVRIAGGGSRHPGWRQLLADVLELPLLAVEAPAASARGAALLGALAVGDLTEDDVAGPLAPPLSLVAEPRQGRTALHHDRLATFRELVAGHFRTGSGASSR